MNQPRTSLILTMSRKRLTAWGLRLGAKVPVNCGQLSGFATVESAPENRDAIRLLWPDGTLHFGNGGLTGQVTYTEEQGVRIGPVIGILTTGLREDLLRPVGARTALLGDFVRGSRELNALCYLFNAQDVNWAKGSVRGATLVGTPVGEKWQFGYFPLPDVVYNRVPHRSAEISPQVAYCKTQIAEWDIPMFNERFLNKREMYKWLLSDERTRELIPTTEKLRTKDSLERFCRAHSLVYLKPIGGSLGIGILKVGQEMQHYQVRYRRQERHVTSKFHNIGALYDFVKRNNPKRTYLMQKGIDLRRYQGNPTDFRVHLHKNGLGQWEVAGIGAKVAGRGAVTTHVHNGGRVLLGEKVLEHWFGNQAPQAQNVLVEASVRVAEVLEDYLSGPVGEWGLDVGIDVDGRVWVFEANAKPGRAIFRHPELREAGQRSRRLLVEYAAYLADYPLVRGGRG